METKETIKTQSSVSALTENYNHALINIFSKIEAFKYVVKINGVEASSKELFVTIKLADLSKSARKKIANRLWNFNQKRTIKSINYLFHVLKKLNVIEEKVKVYVSHKEQEIIKARENYKTLRTQAEAARILYKATKGDFYK